LGAAAGDIFYGCDDVRDLAAVDRDIGAKLPRHVELVLLDVHRDDPGCHGAGYHDRREADTAAAVDGHPVAGADLGLRLEGAEGRREAATQARCSHGIHGLGEAHEVHVGVVDGDELGEGALVGEARLELVVADLLLAAPAGLAVSAAGHEGHGHPLAALPILNVLAYLDDGAGQLVPWHMRQFDVGVVPLPAVPVAAADACGVHLQDDAVFGDNGIRNLGNR
jgi:hypothetical protein